MFTYDKTTLRARYDAILAAGCLDPAQRARVAAGEAVPGVVIQQSGGSTGEAPLRLPKGEAETRWLIDRLCEHHRRAVGASPRRIAFLGGVTHLQAGRVEGLFPGGQTRSFRLREWDELVEFQPDLLSCYPSMARDLVLRSAASLGCVRTLKLGGETVLPADRERLLERLPGVLLLEQFGSTEMPALAFRATTRHLDTGYVLSRDRYAFAFDPPGDGWRELVVRDDFPTRAFPIPGWYRTGDEALLEGDRVVALRRKDDPAVPYLAALDALIRRGLTQVQVDLRERTLRYEAEPDGGAPEQARAGLAGSTESRSQDVRSSREAGERLRRTHHTDVRLEREVVLAGEAFVVERGQVLRLKDSNKAPLVLAAGPRAPTWRRAEEEA